jgi:hypothetical protein
MVWPEEVGRQNDGFSPPGTKKKGRSSARLRASRFNSLHEDVEEIKAHRLAVAALLGVDGGDGKDQDSKRQPWCDGVSPQIRFGLQKKKERREREAWSRRKREEAWSRIKRGRGGSHGEGGAV